MKTILVATDFSANATSALEYAAALAAKINTRLVLFHAYQLPLHASNTLLTPAGVDELVAANKKRLDKIAANTAELFGIEAEGLSHTALLTDILDEVVAEVNAGLVVMGMHINDWGDELFGNTTTSVIRTAAYPVLVVPEGAKYNGICKIMYAYDNSCLSSRNSLMLLKEVASKFGANVEVFHVDKVQQEVAAADPKVEAALENVAHHYKSVATPGVVEGIVKEVETFGADMLAVVPGKNNFWRRMVHQSTTRALALRVQIPLLVLPNDPVVNAN